MRRKQMASNLRRGRSLSPESENYEYTGVSTVQKRLKTVDPDPVDTVIYSKNCYELIEMTPQLQRPTLWRPFQIPVEVSDLDTHTGISIEANGELQKSHTNSSSSSDEASFPQTEPDQVPEENETWYDATADTSSCESVQVSIDNSNGPLQLPHHSPAADDTFSTPCTPDSNSGVLTPATNSDSGSQLKYEDGCFQGLTVINPRCDALQHAGIAVSWRVPQGSTLWNVEARSLKWTESSTITEIYAIAHGLHIAIRLIADNKEAVRIRVSYKVLLFSDCTAAIRAVQKGRAKSKRKKTTSKLISEILSISAYLRRLGVHLKLHWVPGHEKVIGNELSDIAAACVARKKVCSYSITLPHI
ncbi:hypothetical protein N7492_000098 [Penicillium capsulatum]|uniref:RNase H type-1 domain-containing protein n=1 Tax=Penicillium capsulatum TaxID=69766 RepID=A0A9W9LZN8_9EURO|nr:hypothetical protein N7492_000098 [Penicillium capsulatum]